MCIYLLRHGRTAMDTMKRSDGWLDLPLSDKGRIGLIQAQQYLKLEPLEAIYAPPLRRTEETAHIVQSGALSSPDVKTVPEALTWDLGILAGTRKEESRPKVRQLVAHPDRKPMGGESYSDFVNRFVPWFDARAEEVKADGKPILIVCSGSNLRLLGRYLFDDEKAFDLDEGGLTALHWADGSWHHETVVDGQGGGTRYES